MLGAAAAGGGLLGFKLAPPDIQFTLISSMGPVYRLMDAETTHILGIMAAKWGMFPVETRPDPAILKTNVWNRTFPNPLGAQWEVAHITGYSRRFLCGPPMHAAGVAGNVPRCRGRAVRPRHTLDTAHTAAAATLWLDSVCGVSSEATAHLHREVGGG